MDHLHHRDQVSWRSVRWVLESVLKHESDINESVSWSCVSTLMMTDERWSFSADAHLHGLCICQKSLLGQSNSWSSIWKPYFMSHFIFPIEKEISFTGHLVSCFDGWAKHFPGSWLDSGQGVEGWGSVGFVCMEISQLHIKIMFQEQQGCFMAFQFDYRHPFRLHKIECEINQLKWIERLYSTALVNDICYRILSVNLTHSLLSHSENMSWQLPFKNKKGL